MDRLAEILAGLIVGTVLLLLSMTAFVLLLVIRVLTPPCPVCRKRGGRVVVGDDGAWVCHACQACVGPDG